MESSSNVLLVATRKPFDGVKFSTLWNNLKDDEPGDFIYHDGDTWCTDEHLPPPFGTAEALERNKLNFAQMLRNDRFPVCVVNQVFRDACVQSAVGRGLTVGDLCMIRGRSALFGAMHEAEGAMRESDQYAANPQDSFAALCQRQGMQDLFAAYRTGPLTNEGHPVIDDGHGQPLECDGARVFSNHEQSALRSSAWCRAMGTFSGRLARKYGPEIASQVLKSADFVEDMRQQEVQVHYGYHLAWFEDERFWTFDDEKSKVEKQVAAWMGVLPTRQFLEEHGAASYIRGAIASEWQNGERHRSDGRASAMLASASHHVVGRRVDRPLLEAEKNHLRQAVKWIERRCIHDRLESDAPVLDTLPWYVALHRQLDRGIVPPAGCLFDDLRREVEGGRGRARKMSTKLGYERV